MLVLIKHEHVFCCFHIDKGFLLDNLNNFRGGGGADLVNLLVDFGAERHGVSDVLEHILLLAGGDARVREHAVERGYGVACLQPAPRGVLVRDVDDLRIDLRAHFPAGRRDGIEAFRVSPADEESVAALCAGVRKRLADSRACSCDQGIHGW